MDFFKGDYANDGLSSWTVQLATKQRPTTPSLCWSMPFCFALERQAKNLFAINSASAIHMAAMS